MAEYLNRGKFGVYLDSGCFCLFKFQIQARDQNPEYDDYDYMESDMRTAAKHNNSLYYNNWSKYFEYMNIIWVNWHLK